MKLVNEAVAINVVCELWVEILSMLIFESTITSKDRNFTNNEELKTHKTKAQPQAHPVWYLFTGRDYNFVKSDLKIIK